jgi:hypothetical protein
MGALKRNTVNTITLMHQGTTDGIRTVLADTTTHMGRLITIRLRQATGTTRILTVQLMVTIPIIVDSTVMSQPTETFDPTYKG